MTTIYLVRHGQTAWNAQRRQQGHTDIELNENGLVQSEAVARVLTGRGLIAVYSSDLKRALQTARNIATQTGSDLVVKPSLREINEGDWEGRTEAEIRRQWPDVWEQRDNARRPGGESPGSVRDRALIAIRDILAERPSGSVAVVTHQGVIRLLLEAMLSPKEFDLSRFARIGNCEVVSIEASLDNGQPVGSHPMLLTTFGSGHREADGAS